MTAGGAADAERREDMDRQGLQERTDNELMELARLENREAFEVLVLRYYREAIGAAERMVHDEMQAQDIVQDCFADIYVQRCRYLSSFSFRTYLYALIRHKSIDYLRRAGKREILLDEDGEKRLEQRQGGEGSPEEQYLKKERTRRLAERIGQLPKIQREALYLYAAEDRSYREIAQMLQKSVPQIKIAIHRARKKLAETYGGEFRSREESE